MSRDCKRNVNDSQQSGSSDDLDMKGFVGQTLMGRFRLNRFLNEGMFGAVYAASHDAYELELRQVAMKVGKRRISNEEARDMFRDAIDMTKVAECATDPLLKQKFVTVYDAGRCPDGDVLGGHPYVVMEFVHGGSIGTCLKAGAFPLKRAVNYFDQMLEAVAFMHTGIRGPKGDLRPIVHRDIKPDNVLVDRRADGEDVVKMTDFGLSVEVNSLLGWTHSGGDLAYLPLESFTHNICSPQSDVFMLALVFYEMITNQNPFSEVGRHLTGSDAGRAREIRKIHQEARKNETFSLLEQNEEIKRPENRALGEVIRAALAPEMSRRPFDDAQQFLEAWRAAKLGDGATSAAKQPWEVVEDLTDVAEQCAAAMNRDEGRRLLDRALKLNHELSDPMVVGRTFLLAVKWLLQDGEREQAGRVAAEGYHRRRCRSTCEAMACYIRDGNPKLAMRYSKEATTCADRS